MLPNEPIPYLFGRLLTGSIIPALCLNPKFLVSLDIKSLPNTAFGIINRYLINAILFVQIDADLVSGNLDTVLFKFRLYAFKNVKIHSPIIAVF